MLSLLCLCFSIYLVLYSLKTSVIVGSYAIYYGVCYEIVLSLLVDGGVDGWQIYFCISCCLTLIFLYAITDDIFFLSYASFQGEFIYKLFSQNIHGLSSLKRRRLLARGYNRSLF